MMQQLKLTSAYKKDLWLVHTRGYDIENDLLPLLRLFCRTANPFRRGAKTTPSRASGAGIESFMLPRTGS